MSYLVCHVQKFKSSDVKGMQIHNQRESENSKNIDIDSSKKHLNYDIHNNSSINYNHRVKEIIAKGYKGVRGVRKDAVVMTSTLITSDTEFFKKLSPEKQKEFFNIAYKKLVNQYGEENIVSAVVHMDEKTPHMHICSVPLTEDGKLSAKTIFDRKGLRNLQDMIPKELQSKGFDIKRGEIGSERKHTDTHEYKKQQAKDMANKLEKKIESLKKDLKAIEEASRSIVDISSIETKKSLVGAKITIKEKDYEKLITLAKEGIYNSNQIEKLKDENKSLREEIQDLKTDKPEYIKIWNGYNNLKEEHKKVTKRESILFKVIKDEGLLPKLQNEINKLAEPKRSIGRDR